MSAIAASCAEVHGVTPQQAELSERCAMAQFSALKIGPMEYLGTMERLYRVRYMQLAEVCDRLYFATPWQITEVDS